MTDEAYDYGRLLVLQHVDWAGPGSLLETLDARANRRPWDLVDTPTRGVPDLTADVRGILVLGGPMSVHDDEPWLAPEKALLAEAVDAGVPVFGICLGTQLLAEATGGAVTRRDQPALGFADLSRTDEAHDDEIFAGWVDGSLGFFSHEWEVGTLPPGAVPMLTGHNGAVPAYRMADGLSYGVQFHAEITPDTLAGWMERERGQRMAAAVGRTPEDLVDEVRRRDAFTRAAGVSLVGRWIDGVVGRDDPTPRRQRPAAKATSAA